MRVGRVSVEMMLHANLTGGYSYRLQNPFQAYCLCVCERVRGANLTLPGITFQGSGCFGVDLCLQHRNCL